MLRQMVLRKSMTTEIVTEVDKGVVSQVAIVNESGYSPDWQLDLSHRSLRSARVIVPLIASMVKPQSVVDIGCGLGAWLAVFREVGIQDVLGIDGKYIDEANLLIPTDQFVSADLTISLPVRRQFDVVLSLEVAEHLEEKYATAYVENLLALGPVVVFSAAIPFQGGMHHVNEQWPDYWVRKFESFDYILCDVIREEIWDNLEVDFWYSQNLLLFVRKSLLGNYPALQSNWWPNRRYPIAVVHPTNYLGYAKRERDLRTAYESLLSTTEKWRDPKSLSLMELCNLLPGSLTTSITKRLKRVFGA